MLADELTESNCHGAAALQGYLLASCLCAYRNIMWRSCREAALLSVTSRSGFTTCILAAKNMLAALQARRVLLTRSSPQVACRNPTPLLPRRHRSFHCTASTRSNIEKVDLSSPKNDYIGLKLSSNASIYSIPSNDLEVYPNFLTSDEQQVLLTAALKKLDSMASRDERKRRRDWNKANKGKVASSELKSEQRCCSLYNLY